MAGSAMYELVAGLTLVAAGIRAGLTPHLALDALRRTPGPIGVFAATYWSEYLRGVHVETALSIAAEVHPDLRPLATMLMLSATEGYPVADQIERYARERSLRWHRAQLRAARRLPVLMLFPLVLFVLPSFILLTITPVMFGALQSIRGAL